MNFWEALKEFDEAELSGEGAQHRATQEALTCPHIEHDGEKKAFQGRSTHVGTASAPAMCSLAILQVLHATTAHDWRGIDFLMRPRYCLIRALSQSSLIPSIRQKCAW